MGKIDNSVLVTIISSTGLILVALIGAWASIYKGIHNLDIRLTRVETKIDDGILKQNEDSEIIKKVEKNTKIIKLINNKVKNIDNRVLKLETPDISKELSIDNKHVSKK